MTAKQWVKTPKGYILIIMAAFLFIASLGAQDLRGITNALIASGVCAAVETICSLIAKKKRIFPDGAVITGIILAMILSTTTSWQIVAATSVMAILPKYIFAYKKKPIFNPAAFGLLLSVLFFRTGQSWWGAFGDLPAWTVAFLLIGGYAAANRVNKFPQLFSFLGAYFLLLLIMGIFHIGDAVDALRPPFINASLFFALFMLTDPPTSPAKGRDQIIFGILCAIIGAAIYGLFGGLMYLFIGLLAGNLFHYLKARLSSQAPKLQERRRTHSA